jgi:hypothetical protein
MPRPAHCFGGLDNIINGRLSPAPCAEASEYPAPSSWQRGEFVPAVLACQDCGWFAPNRALHGSRPYRGIKGFVRGHVSGSLGPSLRPRDLNRWASARPYLRSLLDYTGVSLIFRLHDFPRFEFSVSHPLPALRAANEQPSIGAACAVQVHRTIGVLLHQGQPVG